MTNYQALDVKQCQLIVGTEEITGGIDGDWITFDVPETQTVGVDANGNSYRITKANRNITLTVNLSVTSKSNDYLSNLSTSVSNIVLTPVKFDDFSTGTELFSEDSVVNWNAGTLASTGERQHSWTIIMLNPIRSIRGLKQIQQ
jgi:hypothetical protein